MACVGTALAAAGLDAECAGFWAGSNADEASMVAVVDLAAAGEAVDVIEELSRDGLSAGGRRAVVWDGGGSCLGDDSSAIPKAVTGSSLT